MPIHKTAIINKGAKIAKNVEIGPNVVIEENVSIGEGTKVYPNAYIFKNTSLGKNCTVYVGAALGGDPQDLAFKNKKSYLKIGDNNIFREYVTIHRGTVEGTSTEVGNNNFFMAGSHAGHNCKIGNNVIIVNGALLGGYVVAEDSCFISGNVIVHQFCRLGRLSMIGGFSAVNKDVPPFMSVRGPSVVASVNIVGLRRAKFDLETIKLIKEAYNLLYLSDLNTKNAAEKIATLSKSDVIKYLVEFIKSSKRGICKYRYEAEDMAFYEGKNVK